MRFYDSKYIERIGFDFYCDIANNIVKAREAKGYTQKNLADKAGIKEQRISNMERVKVRTELDVLEKISKALDVSVDFLIDAELDCYGKECLYLVWPESIPEFQLYIKASSKRMAFLNYDRGLKEHGVKYSTPRERCFVELVGVPTTKETYQAKFPKRTEEDLPIERGDEQKVEKYIEALKGISYFEWIKLRESMDAEFNQQIGESKKKLKFTDSGNVKSIIRSRFGCKLD